jgi:hypothetical protein
VVMIMEGMERKEGKNEWWNEEQATHGSVLFVTESGGFLSTEILEANSPVSFPDRFHSLATAVASRFGRFYG